MLPGIIAVKTRMSICLIKFIGMASSGITFCAPPLCFIYKLKEGKQESIRLQKPRRNNPFYEGTAAEGTPSPPGPQTLFDVP